MDDKRQYKSTSKYCCDPLKQHKSRKKGKDLRMVTTSLITKHPQLQLRRGPGQLLCSACRKTLSQLPEVEAKEIRESALTTALEKKSSSSTTSGEAGASAVLSDDQFVSPEGELTVINKAIGQLGESPFDMVRAQSYKGYALRKKRKIEATLQAKIKIATTSTNLEDETEDDSEITLQLKDKFKSTTKRSEKIMVLTVLPKSWSIRKIAMEFNCSNYMAQRAKSLVAEEGIMSTPNKKAGKNLPDATVTSVKDFYMNDE